MVSFSKILHYYNLKSTSSTFVMTEFMSETAIGHYNLKRMGLVNFIVTYELLLQPVFLIGSFHTTVKPLR